MFGGGGIPTGWNEEAKGLEDLDLEFFFFSHRVSEGLFIQRYINMLKPPLG